MSNLTARDVENAITSTEVESKYGTYTLEWGYELEDSDVKSIEVDGEEFAFEYIEGETGGEGQGEYCYQVVKVGDQFFKKEGYYASHYGTDWDGDFFEVSPQEKTVTVYKRV